MSFSDFRLAPNQSERPDLYEVENRAVDPLGLVLGYWLPGYAAEAATVIGIEPDPTLLPLAAARDPRLRVLAGSAEHIPLPDASVDAVHARFAYFWPPDCAAGSCTAR